VKRLLIGAIAAIAISVISAPTALAGPNNDNDGDIYPQKDGIYTVAGDGFFDTGIMARTITSPGPRPGSPVCTWSRLSGKTDTIANTIEVGQVREGPVTVTIEPTDVAFSSYGCQPWSKARS
jgi:hypothetical protein